MFGIHKHSCTVFTSDIKSSWAELDTPEEEKMSPDELVDVNKNGTSRKIYFIDFLRIGVKCRTFLWSELDILQQLESLLRP